MHILHTALITENEVKGQHSNPIREVEATD